MFRTVYNPRSLWESASRVVCRGNFDFNKVKELLPNPVYRSLCEDMLHCDEQFPNETEIRLLDCFDTFNEMKPVSPEVFRLIQMYPWHETPHFVYEFNHVVTEFYRWIQCKEENGVLSEHLSQNICKWCFISKSNINQIWCGNYWNDKKYIFYWGRYHQVCPDDNVLNILQSKDAWCELCFSELITIYSEEECENATDIHYPPGTETYNVCVPIRGKFVDDEDYEQIKVIEDL